MPRQPWIQGGEQRTVRTDYPGATSPSEQVLGPKKAPQSFNGRWDDRYNFTGYARGEMRRFEAMAERGNLVRIAFQEITYEGIITSWSFPYQRDWYIRYEFTVSIHARPDDLNIDRSPDTTRTASDAYDAVNDQVNAADLRLFEALRAQNLESRLQTEAVQDCKTAMANMTKNRDALADTLDQREWNPSATDKAVSAFRRIATQFRAVRSNALDLIASTAETRSDVDLGVRDAMSVLSYEDWSRSMRFQGRVILGQANEAADAMDERAEPDALRIYRPREGESLYQIARRFYGDAGAWRLIANRNGLTDFELTGDELLIIPERGRG